MDAQVQTQLYLVKGAKNESQRPDTVLFKFKTDNGNSQFGVILRILGLYFNHYHQRVNRHPINKGLDNSPLL